MMVPPVPVVAVIINEFIVMAAVLELAVSGLLAESVTVT